MLLTCCASVVFLMHVIQREIRASLEVASNTYFFIVISCVEHMNSNKIDDQYITF